MTTFKPTTTSYIAQLTVDVHPHNDADWIFDFLTRPMVEWTGVYTEELVSWHNNEWQQDELSTKPMIKHIYTVVYKNEQDMKADEETRAKWAWDLEYDYEWDCTNKLEVTSIGKAALYYEQARAG